MKFRKSPVVIEAFTFTGKNFDSVFAWADRQTDDAPAMHGVKDKLMICTLEGEMTANPGDIIICGVNGEFYPCKPDIFAKTYEPVIE